MTENGFITIAELAEIWGISRIAVYKKVKKGQIKAVKAGKIYLILKKYLNKIIGKELSEESKHKIDEAVKKTVEEYGDVLKMLGKE